MVDVEDLEEVRDGSRLVAVVPGQHKRAKRKQVHLVARTRCSRRQRRWPAAAAATAAVILLLLAGA
jgi:hypothetical protein